MYIFLPEKAWCIWQVLFLENTGCSNPRETWMDGQSESGKEEQF